jgi:hypothetical protein
MPKRKSSTPKTGGLQRLTELVRAGKVSTPWPWALLRSQHFPAETDEASQRKFAEWARENGFEWDLQPETVRIGSSRQQVRVVVLAPGAKRPVKRR